MLSVILTILKILGILILVLLGILLVILLLVLFVPVGYTGHGSFDGKEPCASLKASWLFDAAAFTFTAAPAFGGRFRLLCFTVRQFGKGTGAGGEPPGDGEDNSGNGAEDSGDGTGEPAAAGGDTVPEAPEIVRPGDGGAEDADHSHDADMDTDNASDAGADHVPDGEDAEDAQETPGRAEALYRKLSGAAERILKRLGILKASAEEKKKELKRRYRLITRFIRDEQNTEAFRFLLSKLRLVVRDIRPAELKGRAEYGFSDPGTTGQATELAALLIPLYGDSVEILPVFDREIMDIDLSFSGRIRIWYLAFLALQVILNRGCRRLYRKYRRFRQRL